MSSRLSRMYNSRENGLNDIELKRSILKIEIELETLLKILVDKGIVTHEEINNYKLEIIDDPKYRRKFNYIKSQEEEILNPPTDPALRELIKTIETSERRTCPAVCPPTFRF